MNHPYSGKLVREIIEHDGDFIQWCTTHQSRWDEGREACQIAFPGDPYGTYCRSGVAYVEVVDE